MCFFYVHLYFTKFAFFNSKCSLLMFSFIIAQAEASSSSAAQANCPDNRSTTVSSASATPQPSLSVDDLECGELELDTPEHTGQKQLSLDLLTTTDATDDPPSPVSPLVSPLSLLLEREQERERLRGRVRSPRLRPERSESSGSYDVRDSSRYMRLSRMGERIRVCVHKSASAFSGMARGNLVLRRQLPLHMLSSVAKTDTFDSGSQGGSVSSPYSRSSGSLEALVGYEIGAEDSGAAGEKEAEVDSRSPSPSFQASSSSRCSSSALERAFSLSSELNSFGLTSLSRRLCAPTSPHSLLSPTAVGEPLEGALQGTGPEVMQATTTCSSSSNAAAASKPCMRSQSLNRPTRPMTNLRHRSYLYVPRQSATPQHLLSQSPTPSSASAGAASASASRSESVPISTGLVSEFPMTPSRLLLDFSDQPSSTSISLSPCSYGSPPNQSTAAAASEHFRAASAEPQMQTVRAADSAPQCHHVAEVAEAGSAKSSLSRESTFTTITQQTCGTEEQLHEGAGGLEQEGSAHQHQAVARRTSLTARMLASQAHMRITANSGANSFDARDRREF